MPSPFPGMDPFIEDQQWKDFHHSILSIIRDAIVPLVLPKYIVKVEESVYLFDEEGRAQHNYEPDVTIFDEGRNWTEPTAPRGTVSLQPIPHTLPQPPRIHQAYLAITDRRHRDATTAIEVLSPWNKTPGKGRTAYLNKRESILDTPANLIEIDLLRGGERLPTIETLTPADYYVFVCRPERFPVVDVFPWPLLNVLPKIPIPLAIGDADVTINLQEIFDTVYLRGAYQYSLDYTAQLEPPLNAAQVPLVERILREAGKI